MRVKRPRNRRDGAEVREANCTVRNATPEQLLDCGDEVENPERVHVAVLEQARIALDRPTAAEEGTVDEVRELALELGRRWKRLVARTHVGAPQFVSMHQRTTRS